MHTFSDISDDCKDFIRSCLVVQVPTELIAIVTSYICLTFFFLCQPNQRLGAIGGIEEIQAHPWLSDVDWNTIQRQRLKPPFLPDTTRPCCDITGEEEQKVIERQENSLSIPNEEQHHFER